MERIEELKCQLSVLLQKAGRLDPKQILESRKMVSVWALEGPPVQIKNMISETLGVDTIWKLVHVPYDRMLKFRCFTNSRARMAELVVAIDEALKMLHRHDDCNTSGEENRIANRWRY